MPASLVHSQFEALEPPGADEAALVVDILPTPTDIVRTIVERLR